MKFLDLSAGELHLPLPLLTEQALEKIQSYYWTQNLFELKAAMENSLLGCSKGVIDVDDLAIGEKKIINLPQEDIDDGFKLMSLKEAEKMLIKKALMHTHENRTQAAKILGVSIRTLRNKINEYRTEGSNYFVNLR